MNRNQFLGIVREVGTALGVALVTFGVTTTGTVEILTGIVFAGVSLAYAIKANEGRDIVLSLFRKILSGVSGGLVAWGYLDPAKADAIFALLGVLISSAWSFSSNSNGSPPTGGGNSPLWVFALIAVCLFPSCASSYKKTTFPDGTVVEEKNQAVDATAFAAGANAVTAIAAPRGRVHADK